MEGEQAQALGGVQETTAAEEPASPPALEFPPPPMGDPRVAACVEELLSVRGERAGTEVHLPEEDIIFVCRKAREVFLSQPMLVEVTAPINVCGDTHGQYHDLLRLFEMGGFPPAANYLFMGDYVDRAKQSIETITLLLCYKITYPHNFFLLRGNHECSALNRIYGFFDECKRRYSIKLWRIFGDCFNCMPVTAVIADKIICMHGGLSPDLECLSQIAEIERPTEVPEDGVLCDLLWSDPDAAIAGWGYNSRGVSYTYGSSVVETFLEKHDLDLICRAHQVVEDGYEFHFVRFAFFFAFLSVRSSSRLTLRIARRTDDSSPSSRRPTTAASSTTPPA